MWSIQEELWLQYTCSPEMEQALHWVPGPDGPRLAGSVLPPEWY